MQPFLPIGELTLQALTLKGVSLPLGILAVSYRRCGENHGLISYKGAVKFAQLAEQQADRPSVANHLVQNQKQQMIVFGALDQAHFYQRTAREIERRRRFTIQQPRHRRRAPLSRQTPQVDRPKRYRQFGCDVLNRLSVYAGKGRAENFMAPDNFVDGALERVCI